jgi:hypothetical protein
MKFYREYSYENYLNRVMTNKLIVIYNNGSFCVQFFKNGNEHNSKNASYISNFCKEFCLNGIIYGNQTKFTKHSWRKFAKLQSFL